MAGASPSWKPLGWSGTVGVARRSIAPPLGIRMRNWGYGDRDVSRGQHGDLTASALAIELDGAPALIITADLGWWRTMEDYLQVRDAILGRTGISEHRLLLHLTNTHAGPSICAEDHDLPGGELVPGYLADLASRTADAAAEALDDMAPAVMRAVTTQHPLAVNRDVTWDGRALLGFDPDASADQTLLVMSVDREDGTQAATLVNYACHPTTLGYDNDLVSPDFVGAMRDLVEAQTGAPCLFLQGASGELSPRTQYGARTDLADRHGSSLGHAVLAALSTLPPPGCGLTLTHAIESGAPLAIWEPTAAAWPARSAHSESRIPVELKDLPPIAQLESDWAGIDARSLVERLRRARRLRRTYADMSMPEHPIWVWRLGDLALMAHPGEAYSDLQTVLRERFPSTAVLVLNLTNGPGWVYLPSRSAFDGGRYQSWQTIVREGTLERLIDEATELLVGLGFRRSG